MDPVLLSILCVVSINFLLSVVFFYMLWLVCKKMTLIEKEILVLSMMEEERKPTTTILGSPPMTPKQDDDFYIDYNISTDSNGDLIPENIIKLDDLHKMNVSEDQNDLRIRY